MDLLRISIALSAIFLLAPGGQYVPSPFYNTGSNTGACGTSLSGTFADWWAGSLSSSPVSSWTDSSSGGNTLTGAGSPTWASNTFGAGLPGVTFNGTATQYFSTAVQLPTSGNRLAIGMYGVVHLNSASTPMVLFGNHAVNGPPLLQINNSHLLEYDQENLHLLCQSVSTLTNGNSYEFAVTYDGTNCKVYINGTLDSTGTNTQSTASGFDTVGGIQTSIGWNGAIYELAFTTNTTFQSAAHTCWVARGLP